MLLLALGALALAKPLTVDLETNWAQSPFKVQLLETVAAYNSSAYFPILSVLLSHEEAANRFLSDSEVYDLGLEKSLQSKFISEAELPLVKADLALGTYTAAIESKFSDFGYDASCENVLVYNGRATCDSGAVFALETDAKGDVELLETDRILGGAPDAPWAVLYGDLSTASFPVFHAHLLASALEGKINYVLRYKPPRGAKGAKGGVKEGAAAAPLQKLGGWGATVQVKRTDYLVVDDRGQKGELKLDVDAPNKLAKTDLPKLSHKLTTAILKSKDRFAALKEYVLNLPAHLGALRDVKPSAKLRADAEANGKAHFAPGTNALMVNGVPVSANADYNVYQLLDVVKNELEAVTQLGGLLGEGEGVSVARELLTSGVIDQTAPKRYDYRSDAVLWINDLELGQVYREYPRSLEGIVGNEDQLLTVSRNIHNVVLAVDLENISHLQLVAQLFQLIARKVPVRFGIVPLGQGERAADFCRIAKSGSHFSRQKYILQLIESLDSQLAVREAQKYTQDGAVDPKPSDLEEVIAKWARDFDVGAAAIVANGVMLPASQGWIYDLFEVFGQDDERLKEAVRQGVLDAEDTETDLEELLLGDAARWRDPLVDPLDLSAVDYFSTSSLYEASYGYFAEWSTKVEGASTVWVVGDVTSHRGIKQVLEVMQVPDINVKVLPVLDGARLSDDEYRKHVNSMLEQGKRPAVVAKIALEAFGEHVHNGGPRPKFYSNVTEVLGRDQMTHIQRTFHSDPRRNRFSPRALTLIVDGRVVQVPGVLKAAKVQELLDRENARVAAIAEFLEGSDASSGLSSGAFEQAVSLATATFYRGERVVTSAWAGQNRTATSGSGSEHALSVVAVIDPVSEAAQSIVALLAFVEQLEIASIQVFFSPKEISLEGEPKVPNRYYQGVLPSAPQFEGGAVAAPSAHFDALDDNTLYVVGVDEPAAWVVMTRACEMDLDNLLLNQADSAVHATYELRSLLIEGSAVEAGTTKPPKAQIQLVQGDRALTDTMVMATLGYYQLQANPGHYEIALKGPSADVFELAPVRVALTSLQGAAASFAVGRRPGQEDADPSALPAAEGATGWWSSLASALTRKKPEHADVNIFTVASGHLYERFASIMSLSVMEHTSHTVKFWLIENFLSPSFKKFLPELSAKYGFEYEFVTYKWPSWLRAQSEKQREIWGYKILFLDVLFPQSLDKVMFVDSDQIVRTDLYELVEEDLHGAPYGMTPMGEDRAETEGFRFWKQGYWKNFLKGKRYHISALYVVDLLRFRAMGAGDMLRRHYQQLSADPGSLANLDQDLPNNLQDMVPIHSLSQDWLWCETWCADEGLLTAKTIDLCNNPLTKEPKLDRARRQIPEWQRYDDEVAALREQWAARKQEPEHQEEQVVLEEEEEHYEL